jgi:hypothetical protein
MWAVDDSSRPVKQGSIMEENLVRNNSGYKIQLNAVRKSVADDIMCGVSGQTSQKVIVSKLQQAYNTHP